MYRLLVLSLVCVATSSAKADNYAILVACSSYQSGQFSDLEFTVAETLEFGAVLEASGFEKKNILYMNNDLGGKQGGKYLPTRRNVLRELGLLAGRMTKDDTLIVVFNGHGVHFEKDESSHFCTVEAEIDTDDPQSTMLPMRTIVNGKPFGVLPMLQACPAGRKLLIVSACRNVPNPPNNMAAKRIQLDDKKPDVVPEGLAALFSCSPGEKSYYRKFDDKTQSYFMRNLIAAWKGTHVAEETMDLEDVFGFVCKQTAADAQKFDSSAQKPIADRNYKGRWPIAKPVAMGTAALKRGEVALSRYRYDEAIRELTTAIEEDRKLSAAYVRRAQAYLARSRSVQGLRDAKEGARLAPSSPDALTTLGTAYEQNRLFQEARTVCDEALRENPQFAEAVALDARLLVYYRKLDEAVRRSNRAVAIDAKSVVARVSRAIAFDARKRYDDALDDYNEAIRLEPQRSNTYVNRAFFYLARNDHAKMLADLDQAVELDGKNANTLHRRGNAHALLKHNATAMADHAAAFEIDETAEGYFRRGRSYLTLDDKSSARDDFEKAVRMDPKHGQSYFQIGRLIRGEHKEGNDTLDQVIAAYDQAIKAEPAFIYAYINRAEALIIRKEFKQAIEAYDAAIAIDPEDADAYINRAAAYIGDEQYDKAIDDCTKAIRLDPKSADAYANRASAYSRKSDSANAEADLAMAKKLRGE